REAGAGGKKMNGGVEGRSRSPASRGPYPSPVCSSCAKKKTAPKREAKVKNIAAFPAEKARERKKRMGSIGWGARSSHRTKAASSSAPAASDPRTSALDQPSAC